jgi:hypothetical protein
LTNVPDTLLTPDNSALRTRVEIVEIEDSELNVLMKNETYVAVLYHDNSKVNSHVGTCGD